MNRTRLLSTRLTSLQHTNPTCLPYIFRQCTRRLAIPLQSRRQFTSSNVRNFARTWLRPSPVAKRSFTQEEMESMKDHYPIFGVPIRFLPRNQIYFRPFPSEEYKRGCLIGHLALDILFLMPPLMAWWYYHADSPIFDAPKFTPFSIISKEEVSPTSFILTLRPKPYVLKPELAKADPYAKEWKEGTWSVEFKQPELQIARSYTPLPPRKGDPPGDLRFIIREEANGEMSRYLARLLDGDRVELRGPHTEVKLPEDVTDVVFLAGGTGIAPALQVAYTLLEARMQPQGLPNIRIVWANRKREDCVGGTDVQPKVAQGTEGAIVQELRELQDRYPDNVRVGFVVDEEKTFVDQKIISQLTQRPSGLTDQTVTAGIGSKLLFVSGPEGFVNYLAGPKKYWDGNHFRGEVGGLIGKMGIRNWEIWKQ